MATAGFETPAEFVEEPVEESIEQSAEEPSNSQNGQNGEPSQNGQNGEPSQNGHAEEEAFAIGDDDDDSSDEDLVVTIGEITRGAAFNKGGAAGKIDIDGKPDYDGNMIYDLDLAAMDEKPWQKPGADIADYFNYGFSDETWNLYCERQKKLRAEYGTQKDINKAIMSSINLNSSMPVNVTNLLNASSGGGRQLVNLAGPEKPQKANKMVYDLRLINEQPIQTISHTPQHNEYDQAQPDFKPVIHDNFSSSSTAPPGVEGPPGVDAPSGDDLSQPPPAFDTSVPPPNFNPNVPPPGLGGGMMSMPPPMFNQPVSHVSAGFGNGGGQQQFNQGGRPQPLMGRGYNSSQYDEDRRPPRYRREREEDDDDNRRRKRRYSKSPSPRRRRDDRERERDRDRDRKESSRSKRREERKRSRDREEEYDREKDRKRTRREKSPRESSSRKRREERSIKQEFSPEAPPGVED